VSDKWNGKNGEFKGVQLDMGLLAESLIELSRIPAILQDLLQALKLAFKIIHSQSSHQTTQNLSTPLNFQPILSRQNKQTRADQISRLLFCWKPPKAINNQPDQDTRN
jgi:hypothetical protein